MLLLQARVNTGAMAIKRYSTFSKVPALLEPPSDCLVSYPGHLFGESYLFAVGVFYSPNQLYQLGVDMNRRLIGLDFSAHLAQQGAKWSVTGYMITVCSTTRILSLWVTTHGKQVASLGWKLGSSYLLQWCNWHILGLQVKEQTFFFVFLKSNI